ncbi:DNA recombination protein RmuC [Paraflavitalea sp. CAU 1676]|uniref:DNA recombination protein RmuC n=1 Tax=Paraflavitalea sp. CAU 1676 TaxID=3032598 RepID=UPI0023DA3F8A|nr:DNA recombination protein RmuC [Paraflavitalea sp. CAU 1676]MDF2193786.1 DNA recombination protein RmuC [Paraflavitalea sp. CAU 1676]
MTIEIFLLAAVLLLLVVVIALLMKVAGKNGNSQLSDIRYKVDSLTGEIGRIESAVKTEISVNRTEANAAQKDARLELTRSLQLFGDQLANAMKESAARQKEQLETFSRSLNDFSANQKENFFALLNKQTEQNATTSHRLDQLRETLEKKITELQAGNEKKLDEMRSTVDEKLQKTLESRLGESFKLVSERLEAVHKGLGDMQQLATGVGDLKRVLTNVKTRGILGEYQLESMLEQLLTPEQYGKNVKTKAGSNALVEFAVKLPGKESRDKVLWLPVDSKFPKEDFELLVEAYDKAVPELVEESRRNFVRGIKKCAFDISSKYIDPPNTTDFAILFLPFESLYAEVLRTPGLFETIQREYKIIITGPTTLSALLNSFQMGFRTLAIERRSSEVWQLLGAVKTEFGNFGGILEKTQKKLQEASNVIEQAGVRSRAIEKKLRNVQELPQEEANGLLDNMVDSSFTDDSLAR